MITIGVVVPLVWLGWLVLTEWVPMFPLNDLAASTAKQRAIVAMVNYPVALLVAAGVAVHERWSVLAALALCVLALVGHVVSWWLPYLGVSTRAQREAYQREYARTWKLLPTQGHTVVIDVQHMVVGVLTLAMLAATVAVTMTL